MEMVSDYKSNQCKSVCARPLLFTSYPGNEEREEKRKFFL